MTERDAIFLIKIIKTPEGPAPVGVRIKWMGLELPAIKIPDEVEERDFTTMQEFGNRQGYMVKVDTALAKLREVDLKAFTWFLMNIPPDMNYLTFGPDEVELVPNAEIKKEDL